MQKTFVSSKINYQKGRRLIMGIVNVTPDSFSDGGKYFSAKTAIEHALTLINDGADIIDIGGQSTRPDYIKISAEEEITRIEPVITELVKQIDKPISVDTFYPSVAKRVLELGAAIINDISGEITNEMASVVKEYNAAWILTDNTSLKSNNPAAEVLNNLKLLKEKAVKMGVNPSSICLDPGFGFGKTMNENIELLRNISDLEELDNFILAGVSRKRIIGELCGEQSPENRDEASLAAGVYAAINGADIIRTHNVKITANAFCVINKLVNQQKETK